ncbi:MAG: alpha/beta fold hydrolase [Planctomycetota bacterium]
MAKPRPSIQFYSTRDGHSLASRVWNVDDALADVILLHGIVSHGGWYLPSCDHLASQGFGVHFLERRGSGLNDDHSGDVNQWQTWLNDVSDYLQQLPKDRPRILLGISWGGILACAFARHHAEQIQAMGLICPGLCSLRAASPVQRLGLGIARRLGLSNMRVAIPLKESWLFSQSPKAQRYIDQDPLKLRKITIRFAVENQRLLHEATVHPEQIDVPILLVLSGKDPIVDNPATRQFVERTANRNQAIIEYPESSHTLEFEDDPSNYFNDLSQWLHTVVDETKRASTSCS